MALEIPISDDFVRAELVFDYPLGTLTSDGEVVALNEPQRFTLLSVVNGLEKAVLADRSVAEGARVAFDRESWLPSDEAAAEIFEAHRPHRRYLRGIEGLRTYLAEVQAQETDSPEPLYPHQEQGLRDIIGDLESHDPFAESTQGAYFNVAGGGGKSRMIAMTAAGFKRCEDPRDPNRVLIIAGDRTGG